MDAGKLFICLKNITGIVGERENPLCGGDKGYGMKFSKEFVEGLAEIFFDPESEDEEFMSSFEPPALNLNMKNKF